MMKDKKVIILALICIVLAGVNVVLMGSRDSEAPMIEFSDEVPTYTAGTDFTSVLEDVKAIDDKDDDVSDSLMVEQIFPNDQAELATVVYVAKDKSNNVAKREREVKYVKSETQTETAFVPAVVPGSPVVNLTQNTTAISIGAEFDPMTYVASLSDDKDSQDELLENLQIYGGESVNTAQQGIYHVIYFVEDSEGKRSSEALLTVEVH